MLFVFNNSRLTIIRILKNLSIYLLMNLSLSYSNSNKYYMDIYNLYQICSGYHLIMSSQVSNNWYNTCYHVQTGFQDDSPKYPTCEYWNRHWTQTLFVLKVRLPHLWRTSWVLDICRRSLLGRFSGPIVEPEHFVYILWISL